MNRRNFIKTVGAALAALAMRKWPVAPSIEIVGYELDEDAIMAAMTFGPVVSTDEGVHMEVDFGTEQEMLDAITFIDSSGGRYSYQELEVLASL